MKFYNLVLLFHNEIFEDIFSTTTRMSDFIEFLFNRS